MNHHKRIYIFLFYLLYGIFMFSCRKFVDVDVPITNTSAELVFKNDASAISALNNIYATMSERGIGNGLTSMSLYPGLSADELVLFDHVTDASAISYLTNSLNPTSPDAGNYWGSTYSSYLFFINSAIEGLTNNTSLTPKIKDQLMGEAKFLRGFCYFYLVNLYGDVPLVLSSDYRKNSQISRSGINLVYEQVVKDLKEAKVLLNDNYLDGTLLSSSGERITPNRSTAIALLSRVYLYQKNWTEAEKEASSVIANNLYDTVPLLDVFIKNSKETIWSLQSVSSSLSNTSDAYVFLQPKVFLLGSRFYLRNTLINSFEIGDKRRLNWIDSIVDNGKTYYLSSKYKIFESQQPEKERTVIFRLAEQFLIRAEARLEIGDIGGAISDLNIIRQRAGLSAIISDTKENILMAILHERQVELFTEWGHRWLDLKRRNLADAILKGIKGSNWQTTDQLYPIPASEILINHQLDGDQNPGY